MTLLRIGILLSLLLSINQELFGQQKKPKWVKKINAQLEDQLRPLPNAIYTDSTFWNLPWSLKKRLSANYFSSFSLDTLPNGIERLSLGVFNPSRQLQDLLRGRYFTLYFKDSKILKVSESYNNNNRMGSCGVLTIIHNAYFKNNEISYLETKEEPFTCYGDQADSLLLLELGKYFLDFRKLLHFNLFLQEIEKYKAEIHYQPKRHPYPLDQKINIEAYELKWVKHFFEPPFQPIKKNKNNLFLFPSGVLEVIGDKYLIKEAIQNDPPMGIQPYTLFYFEKKN